ncbi:dephospho-CoA kinase [Rhodocaloribacter litoris]|uniref:dephospho-CoA kinase n=1 Tax=Rhodocaloribacter litoris TaxID=2558931 RepID=UPI00141EA1E7|nr:dephospho-CoA kinase [Rhodocaloribacter litoris]QXD14370.1 dephospho-CoA kinase [Rhodocaloribacter litoris]GIV60608.1 MAG: dephospho-CoA kinase [Rhodothermaceae bacterium]
MVKTLGVTGGIGSGKTTVCRMLEALGARVFYADDEAKRIMAEDPAVRAELVDAFGPASYDAAGRLNRAYLAQQVFGDEANVARINAIVHPRVYAAFEQARRRAEADGVPLLVKEAALIFETGGDRHLDAVAVVDAPVEERIRRVAERDGATPGQVRARMAHQLPPEELRRRADFVIENDGDLAHLRRQVERLYRTMTGRQTGAPGTG